MRSVISARLSRLERDHPRVLTREQALAEMRRYIKADPVATPIVDEFIRRDTGDGPDNPELSRLGRDELMARFTARLITIPGGRALMRIVALSTSDRESGAGTPAGGAQAHFQRGAQRAGEMTDG